MDVTYRIDQIRFGILSPKEIYDMSVVEVTKPLTYENGRPVPGGLNDPRMGVIEQGETCKTCYLKKDKCPGHFGHITLEIPVFNVEFISGSRMGNSISIKNVLELVCIKCGKMLIDIPEEIDSVNEKQRIPYLRDMIGSKRICKSKHGCGMEQPKYSFGTLNHLTYSYSTAGKEKVKQELAPEYVLRLFKMISDESVEAMGMSPQYSRPEWMILTHFPVPPPALRPSIKSENAKSEDDLVTAYMYIIKENNNVARARETGRTKLLKTHQKLVNFYINAMINGKGKGAGDSALKAFSSGGRELKSIKDRLSSKEGRMRGNLMGKRVDFSARTVITPDPSLNLDQLGVPMEIAMNLTFPEVVTNRNIEYLYRLLYNGPKKYPGANTIHQKDGSTKMVKYVDVKNLVLQEGDVVERHLQDGDIVLFNRQPSLHKMSMMAFRIVVLPERTFRINVSATTLKGVEE